LRNASHKADNLETHVQLRIRFDFVVGAIPGAAYRRDVDLIED
jgi:hypothetical protein